MAGREQPYDPYIPTNSRDEAAYNREERGPHRENAGPQRTDVIQEQIKETVKKMEDNLKEVNTRGTHIVRLNEQAEHLQTNSEYFKKGANRVRKQMFFKNVKMWIWIILGLAIIAIIVGVAVSQAKK